ncbi:MAG: antibiotic transporter [Treponema sp.]|nr:MAG: antibiotic transporter [Treponema sp.]
MKKESNKEKLQKIHILDRFYSKPILLVLLILGITLFLGLQLFRLKIDNNNFNFIPKDDPSRILNEEVAKIFGNDNPILIGIERKFTSILEKDFIDELRKLDNELTGLPLVKRTVSIINIKHIESKDGAMIAGPLIPSDYEGSAKEMAEVRYKLRDWNEMYARNLISDDLQSIQFIVFLDINDDEAGTPEAIDVCRKILAISENWDFHDSSIYVTGTTVFSEVVNQATAHDLAFLIPIVVFVVVGVLLLSFRRFLGVLLPLLTVIISVIWALGSMALFNVPLSILSTVLPVILIAVGSAYGIHIISHYFDDVAGNRELSKEEHKNAVIACVKKIILPVFLAALTTFAGFVSFCFTSVVPIRYFGIFSSLGVMSAFIVAVAFIPPILILLGPTSPKKPRKQQHGNYKLDGFLANTFMIVSNHKRSVFLLFIITLGLAYFGIKRLVIDNILVEYFKNDHTIAKADSFCRKNFSGSKQLILLVEAEEDNVVTRPDVLVAVDDLSSYLTGRIDEVGNVTSISGLIKRMNQVLNADSPPDGLKPVTGRGEDDFCELGDFSGLEDSSIDNEVSENQTSGNNALDDMDFNEVMDFLDGAVKNRNDADMTAEEFIAMLSKKVNYKGITYYEIPSIPEKYGKTTQEELHELINDYLILLSSNTKEFMDNPINPRVLKISVQIRTVGQQDTDKIVADIQNFINQRFPSDVKVKIAGPSVVEGSLNKLVVQSQLVSLGISLAIVFIILAVFYRSPVAGIIGIMPLIFSISINFGVMGFFGIKINIGTAMVASFAIGIGIDYTIHYLAAYHREIIRKNRQGDFLYRTFYGSGKAILFNALSVGAGFAVLTFSDFKMLSDLGLLICLVMVTSSLASLTILPLFLNVLKPKFIKMVYNRDEDYIDSENENLMIYDDNVTENNIAKKNISKED